MTVPVHHHLHFAALAAAALCVSTLISGCANGPVANPIAVLSSPEGLPSSQSQALKQLSGDSTPEYRKVLKRIVTQPGYTTPIREEAFNQLYASDKQGLKDALDLTFPKMQMLEWRRTLCEKFVELHWTEMTPTLINGLAFNMAGWIEKDEDRPEYIAIATLNGQEKVPDVLYDALLNSNPVTQSGLRARCWELLWKSGNKERLVALVQDSRVKPEDAFLTDLRHSARDFDLLPRNREEILWLMKLQEPANEGFWKEAVKAVGMMSPAARETLELRDLAVAVAAMKHRPELLTLSTTELYPRLESVVKSEGRKTYSPSYEGYGGNHSESLYQRRDELKWGDYAAMLMACDLMEQPTARNHIFDLADRDLQDRSTEYGGTITVDDQGRFEIHEFRPRFAGSDVRFEASQEMFDSAYTALFHFHNHAQAYDNQRYAGPHEGDAAYADNTRANCLVFTFIDRKTMDVDFYRYNHLTVDLGTIKRGGSD